MERRVVYDSDAVQPGRCPTCGKRLDRCSCTPSRTAKPATASPLNLPNDGVVRILRDRKGRGGKGVTVVAGLNAPPRAMTELSSELKRVCATGGTVRGDMLEFQGDVRERLKIELEKRGYRVKLAGG